MSKREERKPEKKAEEKKVEPKIGITRFGQPAAPRYGNKDEKKKYGAV